MSFQENLRTLRLARGLTQPLLAEKAGIEQSYLSKLENGRSRPSEEVLARLAQALEVKPETLQQNGDETEDRHRRWKRVTLAGGTAFALVAVFLLGRATAVYPLSFGQVMGGTEGNADLTRQILQVAPPGVEVIMLSRNGPGGNHVSISGDAADATLVDAYMEAVRKRFGGSFMVIHVSPRVPGRPQDFSLDYVVNGGR